MAKTREVRERIHTITATQQITQAMKMVAVARLRKAKQKISQLVAYSTAFLALFEQITFAQKGSLASCYLTQRPVQHVLLVCLTTEKGFCGNFNHRVVQQTMDYYKRYTAAGKQVTIFPIGKKGEKKLQKNGIPHTPHSYAWAYEKLGSVAMHAFKDKKYDQVIMVYHTTKTITQKDVITEQFLPIPPAAKQTMPRDEVDCLYEPDPKAIVDYMLPSVLELRLQQALLKAQVAEQYTRMIAMSKATDNADALLKELQLVYNRTRQAAVTRAITEIAAGAGAL